MTTRHPFHCTLERDRSARGGRTLLRTRASQPRHASTGVARLTRDDNRNHPMEQDSDSFNDLGLVGLSRAAPLEDDRPEVAADASERVVLRLGIISRTA